MANRLVDPGAMRHRVTILRAGTPTRDGHGELVDGTPVETVRWAAVTPAPGTERFASGELAASAPMRFVFRWKRDLVRVTDRLRDEGRIYEVKAVVEIGHREGVEVLAVARGEG